MQDASDSDALLRHEAATRPCPTRRTDIRRPVAVCSIRPVECCRAHRLAPHTHTSPTRQSDRAHTHTLHGAAAASPTPYHIRYRALRSHRSATELFKRAPPRCAPVPCTFRDQHPGDAARPHRGQTASCPHRRRSEAHMKERPRAHAEARTRAHTHAWPLTSQACLHRPPGRWHACTTGCTRETAVRAALPWAMGNSHPRPPPPQHTRSSCAAHAAPCLQRVLSARSCLLSAP